MYYVYKQIDSITFKNFSLRRYGFYISEQTKDLNPNRMTDEKSVNQNYMMLQQYS